MFKHKGQMQRNLFKPQIKVENVDTSDYIVGILQ